MTSCILFYTPSLEGSLLQLGAFFFLMPRPFLRTSFDIVVAPSMEYYVTGRKYTDH